MDKYPKELALIGVQPLVLNDYGGALRPRIRARIPDALKLALQVLREWGAAVNKRRSPPRNGDGISPAALEMSTREANRT